MNSNTVGSSLILELLSTRDFGPSAACAHLRTGTDWANTSSADAIWTSLSLVPDLYYILRPILYYSGFFGDGKLESLEARRIRSSPRKFSHPCPTRIEAFQGLNSKLGINDYEDLYARLVQCPEIRQLEMSLTQDGCVLGPDSEFAFQWGWNHCFPPLENLTILHYDWEQLTPYRNLPALLTGRKPNVELWRDAMDWSQLKRLDMDLPSAVFLDTFSGSLTGLEELVWRAQLGFWGDEETICDMSHEGDALRAKYERFIETLPRLQRLQVSGTGKHLNLTRILRKHGPALQHFGLNELEGDCYWWTNASRPFMDPKGLQQINALAPNLRSISLDVERSGKPELEGWGWATLDVLATFPQVSRIFLHFDLEDRNDEQHKEHCSEASSATTDEVAQSFCSRPSLMKPELTGPEALKIFQHLRKKKAGVSLERLRVWTGNVGSPDGGGLRLWSPEEYNIPIEFDCSSRYEGVDGTNLGACCVQRRQWSLKWSHGRPINAPRVCEDQEASEEEHRNYREEQESKKQFEQPPLRLASRSSCREDDGQEACEHELRDVGGGRG